MESIFLGKLRRPWYRRPGPLIALGLTAALFLAVVPPLVAAPTPVGLSPSGQAYAEGSGWYASEIGALQVDLAGGLVSVQAEALAKDDAGGVAAGYSWGSVKLPVTGLVARHLVEERIRESVIDQLGREGVRIEPLTEQEKAFTANGHNGRLTHYVGSTRGSDLLAFEVDIEIAILTWRCSILGAYGIAFGVGKIEALETEDDVVNFVHDALNGAEPSAPGQDDPLGGLRDPLGNPPGDLDSSLDEAPAALDDPLHMIEAPLESPYLEEILDRLMPHTVCAP